MTNIYPRFFLFAVALLIIPSVAIAEFRFHSAIVKVDQGHSIELDLSSFSKGRSPIFQRQISERIIALQWSGSAWQGRSRTLSAISELSNDPQIEYAHPDWDMALADCASCEGAPYYLSPNDPLYGLQWNIPGFLWGGGAPSVWMYWTAGDPGIKIGIIDTGRTNHPDLIAQWHPLLEYNAVDQTSNANDNGIWRHGTFVASIAAAATDNGEGIISICPDCTLVPIKISDDAGSIQISYLIDAIDWATDNGIQILNLSLEAAFPCNHPEVAGLRDAIAQAHSQGVHIVAAAGNQSSNAANFIPASCSGVISVGALDQDGQLASYSNFGAIDLVAPAGGGVLNGPPYSGFGEGIGCPTDSNSFFPYMLGSVGAWTTSPASGNVHCYRYLSGTSVAAPYVAGAIGLMLSHRLNNYPLDPLTPSEVTQILINEAYPLSPGVCPEGCGAGIVDVFWSTYSASVF